MKKLCIFAVVLAILLSFPVFGTEEAAFTVQVDRLCPAPGESVTVRVYGPALHTPGAEFRLLFDESRFELTACRLENAELKKNQHISGGVVLGRGEISVFDLPGGLWATVVLRAKAKEGPAVLSFRAEVYGADFAPVPVQVPGPMTLTVSAPQAPSLPDATEGTAVTESQAPTVQETEEPTAPGETEPPVTGPEPPTESTEYTAATETPAVPEAPKRPAFLLWGILAGATVLCVALGLFLWKKKR